MSGGVPPPLAALSIDPQSRFAIVASRWHGELVDSLLLGARGAFADVGIEDGRIAVRRVPGVFELPLAAQRMAGVERLAAVVALGVVVRGATPHFDYVCQACAHGLTRVSLDCDTPLGFGVITANDIDQARERAGWQRDDGGTWAFQDRHNKGWDAVLAALEMAAQPQLAP